MDSLAIGYLVDCLYNLIYYQGSVKMINYTFKNEATSKEALKVIVGKRYSYILDTIDYLYRDSAGTTSQGFTCETRLDVWLGSRGTVYIDFFVKTDSNEHYRYCYANFVINRKIKSLTVSVKFKYGTDAEERYTSYKDIEIPKKEKLTTVFMRCM